MTHFWPTETFPTEYGLSAKELADNRVCQREHRAHWQVIAYKGNRSAFNGYRWTRSDYSAIRCAPPGGCGRIWRTKAAYVDSLPDAPADWWN